MPFHEGAFIRAVGRRYGNEPVYLIRGLTIINKKCIMMRLRKEYLLNCLENNIFPGHLEILFRSFRPIKIPLTTDELRKTRAMVRSTAETKKQFLMVDIESTAENEKIYYSQYCRIYESLVEIVPEGMLKVFLRHQEKGLKRFAAEERAKLDRRLQIRANCLPLCSSDSEASTPDSSDVSSIEDLSDEDFVDLEGDEEEKRAYLRALTFREGDFEFRLPEGDPAHLAVFEFVARIRNHVERLQPGITKDRCSCVLNNILRNFNTKICEQNMNDEEFLAQLQEDIDQIIRIEVEMDGLQGELSQIDIGLM